jgi:hypothetical protein
LVRFIDAGFKRRRRQMMRFSSFKHLAFGAAALLATSSAVIAQDAAVNPTNTEAGPVNSPPPPQEPLSVTVNAGRYTTGAAAGNGSAGAGTGTMSSNGNVKGIGLYTAAPGLACQTLPGTDIPSECPQ